MPSSGCSVLHEVNINLKKTLWPSKLVFLDYDMLHTTDRHSIFSRLSFFFYQNDLHVFANNITKQNNKKLEQDTIK